MKREKDPRPALIERLWRRLNCDKAEEVDPWLRAWADLDVRQYPWTKAGRDRRQIL